MELLLQKIVEYQIPVVDVHPRFESAAELLEFTRPLQCVEGFIVDFGGHKVKVKAEEYVRIHKTKDLIRFERNIADIIINEQIDDVLSLLDEADSKLVHDYEVRFDAAFNKTLARIESLVDEAKTKYGSIKKDVALQFVPTLRFKEDASFIFSALDGKDIRELLITKIRNSVTGNTKYDQLVLWMEL